MEWKEYFSNVFKGVALSIIITIILTALLSIAMLFVDIKDSLYSGIYVGITSISLILGTILASRLHGEKGWLVGLSVGALFYISLYAIGVLFGAEATLKLYDLIKFSLCILVGILSGMLGINLGKE